MDTHPIENRPAAEVVLTTLHAGGKFNGNSYQVSGGIHGVGVSVVNALSEWLELEIKQNGQVFQQRYERGVPLAPLAVTGTTSATGTKITYKPDNTIFEDFDFSYDILSQRLRELAFLNGGLRITIQDERTEKKQAFLYEGGIVSFIEYLNKKKMPSKEAFFDRFHEFIIKAPKSFQYAVESRNPNYLSDALFKFLKEHNLGYVYLEGYYMPHIGEVFEKYKPETADFSIIRLHGGERLEIELETGGKWDQVVSPKPEGLKAAAQITEENLRRKIVTFINVNNHFEGSAPISIQRFSELLQKK